MFEVVEIRDHIGRLDDVPAQPIFGARPPREEMELEVERRQIRASVALVPGGLRQFVEVSALPFRRRLDGYVLPGLDRVERAGFDLLGLVRKLGAQLAIFADMQPLERARTQRRADADRRAIAELERARAIL